MTEPQTSAPEPGGAGGLAADAQRDAEPGRQQATAPGAQSGAQPTVPPQAGAPGMDGGTGADGMAGGTGGQGRAGGARTADASTGGGARDAAASFGGVGAAVAQMAWTAALAAAIGMIAVGILLLVWPHATLTVVAILIGAALVVTGLLRLFDGVTARGDAGAMRAANIVIGLLAIIAGLYCLKHHSLTVLVVAIVVGVFWIIHGIGDILVAATSGPMPGRTFTAVGGLFSLAAGLVILFWPSVSLILLLTILGAWLLFYGVVLGALAFGLRREAKAAADPRAAQPVPA
jgi:uncharacterized membrane protein HdeD (DUF308 family)